MDSVDDVVGRCNAGDLGPFEESFPGESLPQSGDKRLTALELMGGSVIARDGDSTSPANFPFCLNGEIEGLVGGEGGADFRPGDSKGV